MILRTLTILIVLVLAATVIMPPVAPPARAAEPVTPAWVTTCPADTVPAEGQAWWEPAFGHTHVGFCAPVGAQLTGPRTFDLHVIMHDTPGILTQVDVGVAEIPGTNLVQTNPNATCPQPGTCQFDYSLAWTPTAITRDGWVTLRYRAQVLEPDGQILLVSAHVPVEIVQGNPRQDWSPTTVNGSKDYITGKGWYGDWAAPDDGYVNPYVFSPMRAGVTADGMATFRMRTQRSTAHSAINRTIVKLDATHDSPGTTLMDTPGPANTPFDLAVDTTLLAEGWHSLLIRAEAPGLDGVNTLAGVTKIWFRVFRDGCG